MWNKFTQIQHVTQCLCIGSIYNPIVLVCPIIIPHTKNNFRLGINWINFIHLSVCLSLFESLKHYIQMGICVHFKKLRVKNVNLKLREEKVHTLNPLQFQSWCVTKIEELVTLKWLTGSHFQSLTGSHFPNVNILKTIFINPS